jgi:hypothetical protein
VFVGLLETSSKIPDAQGAGIDGMTGRDGDANSSASVNTFKDNWEQGMTADFCGDQIFKHLADGRFYCLLMDSSDTSPAIDMILANRCENVPLYLAISS